MAGTPGREELREVGGAYLVTWRRGGVRCERVTLVEVRVIPAADGQHLGKPLPLEQAYRSLKSPVIV